MKNLIFRWLAVIAIAAAATACSLDKLEQEQVEVIPDGYGALSLSSLKIGDELENTGGDGSVFVEGEDDLETTRSGAGSNIGTRAVDTDGFYIEIYDVAAQSVIELKKYADGAEPTAYLDGVDTSKKKISVSALDSQKIALEAGRLYRVRAYSDSTMGANLPGKVVVTTDANGVATSTPDPADVDVTCPYYIGEKDVTVGSRATENVTVKCTLATVMVTVEFTADLKKMFDDTLNAQVAVGADFTDHNNYNLYEFGKASNHGVAAEVDANGAVVKPAVPATPKVYFKDVAGANNSNGNSMQIILSGKYYTGSPDDITNGTANNQENLSKWKEVTSSTTIDNVKAAQWRQITVALDNNYMGGLVFDVTIKNFTVNDEITVDAAKHKMYVDFATMEVPIVDPAANDPLAPIVAIKGQSTLEFSYGKADADANGWNKDLTFSITPQQTGATSSSKVKLMDLYAVVASTDTSKSLITALAANGFKGGRVDLYPANKASKYCTIKPDSLTGGVTVDLTTAGLSGIYRHPGTHTISVYATDTEYRLKKWDVKITTSGYEEGADVPGGTGGTGGGSSSSDGVKPTIVWMKNGTDVIDSEHTLNSSNASGFQCVIDIKSTEGISKFNVTIDSEVLTDEELGSVGLGANLDLINPGSMADGLKGLGLLPSSGTWKGATEIKFDIGAFMGLLYKLYQSEGKTGACNFILTVGDSDGDTTKTVKFKIE